MKKGEESEAAANAAKNDSTAVSEETAKTNPNP